MEWFCCVLVLIYFQGSIHKEGLILYIKKSIFLMQWYKCEMNWQSGLDNKKPLNLNKYRIKLAEWPG